LCQIAQLDALKKGLLIRTELASLYLQHTAIGIKNGFLKKYGKGISRR
jgi:hypothetical protein